MSIETTSARIQELKRELARERPRAPVRRQVRRPKRQTIGLRAILIGIGKVAAIMTLPFLLFARGSVYLYVHGAATWAAVGAAMTVSFSLIAWYAASLSRRFTGRARFATMMKWVALPLAVGWCGYALFYLASVNAKSGDVRQSYIAVHPILRIALATEILADGDLVVTDMKRAPADYVRMGLPIFDRTLHYTQADGWVHAVDLRTNGHGETRNRAVQLYFWMMGFRTLRHVGTADHLHVELPSRP